MSSADTAQRLLSLLPAIYRENEFLGRYLWAFEQVLLELEQRIDTLDTLFDPLALPDRDLAFLPWLASWTAFTLRANLPIEQQREFIAKLIPLYRRRGTKENLEKLLAIFVQVTPTITENVSDAGADAPHFFHVRIARHRADTGELARLGAIARALIELEKPAHTAYSLEDIFPTMKVGVFSTVGKDTLLGSGTDA
jgi:phage tail-like protein